MSDYQNGTTVSNDKSAQSIWAQQNGSIAGQAAGMGGILGQSGLGCINVSQAPVVTRQQLIDMSLKLQEALSLITQALGRCR